jgi:nitric oxide dioxygenase
MLSVPHRNIVKANVPVLEQGGEALTTHFYRILLQDHPEVRPLFNPAHQADGAQPRALAHGLLKVARHIDQLDVLGDLFAVIVNKHVSLQIQPEHYPAVGASLLQAIREVLGPDVATDDVIEAWAATYGLLAGMLTSAEGQAYDTIAAAPGGWRGGRAFRVTDKRQESAEITSFTFAPVDGAPVMDFTPGQYIGLRLFVDGVEVRRNYSLSATANGRDYRISVKREPGGVVSNHLHDQIRIDDVVHLFPPAGHFTLQGGARPVVLISGGVGITPMLPLMSAALATGREVRFIHCARSAEVHAFRGWVDDHLERHPALSTFYCYERHEGMVAGDNDADDNHAAPPPHAVGRLTQARLADWLPDDRDVDAYVIGPKPFMASVLKDLRALDVPPAQCRYEFFGPAEPL